MSSQNPPTIIELIDKVDSECGKAQINAITTSTNGIKTLAIQLVQFAELSKKHATEILRLQELLRRNNIQFTLPTSEPVKLPENTALVPEPTLETPPTTNL